MNLVLIERHELETGGRVLLRDARADHLRSVLKVLPGDRVRVGLLDGALGEGVVMRVEPSGVELSCALQDEVPALARVDLLLALPRPKVLQRLWSQLAALGVGRIVLTNAARVERQYFDTHVLTERCYRPLLIEGLQQARDTRLPRVSIHRQFRTLVEDELDVICAGDGQRLVAHPGSGPPVEGAVGRHADRLLLAIGPEGGWNAFELGLLARRRFEPVSMGPRTLRTDTAVVALLALAHNALGYRSAAESHSHLQRS